MGCFFCAYILHKIYFSAFLMKHTEHDINQPLMPSDIFLKLIIMFLKFWI